MHNHILVPSDTTIDEKLKILSDAAKYDVACTSSGVDRKGNGKDLGSASACGICHTFANDGRCISLLKILFTNECIFDCKYCLNRASNDVPRATFTPEEVCSLTVEFYRRNYIEGLFLSSGIIKSPDYTMGLIYEAIYKLRAEHHFNGYIHVKGIPGSDPELVERLGYLVDRMSVNLELPTSEGLSQLAPHKNRKNILTPMKEIQTGIHNNRHLHKIYDKYTHIKMTEGGYGDTKSLDDMGLDKKYLQESRERLQERVGSKGIDTHSGMNDVDEIAAHANSGTASNKVGTNGRYFVPAGQSTQMIIGATPESDYHIIHVSEALYHNYDLKRVFYSAYVPINEDRNLPALGTKPPLLREHRLYQADWLLRFYGFQAGELLTEEKPFFNELIDPKCDWAVRHLELFPVEINRADYYTLLRVPGIGVKSAKRIIAARRYGNLDFSHIKKMGVVLKRALYFITCSGKMMYETKIEERYITNQLIYSEKIPVFDKEPEYHQLNIFDLIKSEKLVTSSEIQ